MTEVNAVVGEAVGTTSIVTLFNSSRAQIELYLDETDMDKLVVGNEVEVVFDALPDLTLTGQIIRINPSLVVVDGVPVMNVDGSDQRPLFSANSLGGLILQYNGVDERAFSWG